MTEAEKDEIQAPPRVRKVLGMLHTKVGAVAVHEDPAADPGVSR